MDAARSVTIVGAGRMGLGLAEAFSLAGTAVTLVDQTPALGRAALAALATRIDAHVAGGLIEAGAAATVTAAERIEDGVREAELVIEAVTEDAEVKRAVLAAIAAAVPDAAIIATNTSAMDIDGLAVAVGGPERFLGMHFFNPPEWTPGVEVIPGALTDEAVVARVVALLEALGKRPTVVRSSVGFLANRLQVALLLEAIRCVQEGLATPAQIDRVVSSTFGFRLPVTGLFRIADMAGLHTLEAVVRQHEEAFGERFAVPELLRAMVADGRTGASAGSGFYDYAPGEAEQLAAARDHRLGALSQLLAEPAAAGERAGAS